MDRPRYRFGFFLFTLAAIIVVAGCQTTPDYPITSTSSPETDGDRAPDLEQGHGLASGESVADASLERLSAPPVANRPAPPEASHGPALRVDDALVSPERPEMATVVRLALPAPEIPAESGVARAQDAEPNTRENSPTRTDTAGTTDTASTKDATFVGSAESTEAAGFAEPSAAPAATSPRAAAQTSPRAAAATSAATAQPPSSTAPGIPGAAAMRSTLTTASRATPSGPGPAPAVTVLPEPIPDAAGPVPTPSAVVDEMPLGATWLRPAVQLDPNRQADITLPGDGWLYVGSEFGSGVADLIGKRTVSGNDVFTFRFSDHGEYGLWFQREDRATGEVVNERLQVSAGAAPEEPGGVAASPEGGAPQSSPTGASAPGSGVPEVAAFNSGNRSGASSAAATDAGSPVTEGSGDRALLAAEAEAAGDLVRAGDLWVMVLAEGGSSAADAGRRLFEIGESLGDASYLNASIAALERNGQLSPDDLGAAARSVEATSPADAVRFYDRLLSYREPGIEIDTVYYRLAQILEKPGPSRDVGRARDLYETIVSVYPLSEHWDASSRRAEYIKRHFFDIR